MFCCTLLYVHSSIAIILMGKRELIALLNLSSWCLAVVERLFLAVPWCYLQFVIVVFPDHTHLLFLYIMNVHRAQLSANRRTEDLILSGKSFMKIRKRIRHKMDPWDTLDKPGTSSDLG